MTKKVFEEYVFDSEMSQPKRVAHFLDWSAKHMPRQWHQYNLVLKAINGYKGLPRLDSKEVLALKDTMSRVRSILLTVYKRGMVTARGVGIRATVDDADLLVHDVSKKGKALGTAISKFTEVVNLVNPANIPKTKEMAPYLPYLKQAKDVVATFGSPDFLQRLLPPQTEVKKTP